MMFTRRALAHVQISRFHAVSSIAARYSSLQRSSLELVKSHFKDDFNLYTKIDLISELSEQVSGNGPVRIRVGLLTNDLRNKNFVDTLLVDPFDVGDWYHELKNRDLSKNNLIKIVDGTDNGGNIGVGADENIDVYNVSKINDRLALPSTQLEFLEINDLQEHDRSQVSGAKLILNGDANDAQTGQHVARTNNFNCHYYIFVKSSSFEDLPNDERFVNWPIVSIVNQEAVVKLPSELVVDLAAAQRANELLMDSPKNASAYTDLIFASNLFLLIDMINSKNPQSVINDLVLSVVMQLYSQLSSELNGAGIKSTSTDYSSNYYKTKMQNLNNLQAYLTDQVKKWEQESHLELQQSVQPYCERLMNPGFVNVVRILFKIDDLNVIYENLLLTNGFLEKSERQFEYLKGKIGSAGDVDVDHGTMDSFDKLKQELRATRLPTLQDQIHTHVLKEFWTTQLPVLTVCTVLNIFYNIDINTLALIGSFAVVFGLSNISNKVLAELDLLKKWYQEANRVCISENCGILNELVAQRVGNDKTVLKSKFELIKGLEKALEK